MSIFMQPYSDTGARIANVAVIMLAYVAFIPTVRSVIPPVPYPTISDLVIFINLIACMITIIQTVLVANGFIKYSAPLIILTACL